MNLTFKNNIEKDQKTSKYAILIISLAACFLFYKYILQIFPSIITSDLMHQFKLSGTGLGALAATFYYSYTIMQLFVGVLLDKYSTKWLTSIAILVSAIGVMTFAKSETLIFAALSRSLMGIGVAFATVSYMKLAAVWFPPRQYAFVSGLLATAAMAGAVFGQAPLAWLVNKFGWQSSLLNVGISGLVLALIFVFCVKDKKDQISKQTQTKKIDFADLMTVFKSKQNWLLTIYSGLAFAPVAVFGGLWGNPFLEQAYHLTKTQAASMVSLVFIGLGLGSPILGAVSNYFNNRREVMLWSTLTSCFAISLVLYWQELPMPLLSLLLFVFGFGIGAFMLVFTIGKEINSAALTATVIAMINTSDAVLDAITEPLIGYFLDLGWDGLIVNGTHQFSLHNYQVAMFVLPCYLLCASILLLWLKRS